LYEDEDPEFGDKGTVEKSGAGSFYDLYGFFARFWSMSWEEYILLPVRVRRKLEKAFDYHMEKVPHTSL